MAAFVDEETDVTTERLHPNRQSEKTRIAKEVDTRACESALWIALVCAQRAGLDGLVDGISREHRRAGAERRAIECATDASEQGAAA